MYPVKVTTFLTHLSSFALISLALFNWLQLVMYNFYATIEPNYFTLVFYLHFTNLRSTLYANRKSPYSNSNYFSSTASIRSIVITVSLLWCWIDKYTNCCRNYCWTAAVWKWNYWVITVLYGDILYYKHYEYTHSSLRINLKESTINIFLGGMHLNVFLLIKVEGSFPFHQIKNRTLLYWTTMAKVPCW